jgi:hypothetical protein
MAGGDGTASVLITHEGVDRDEMLDVLRHRWPHAGVKELELEEPTLAMTAEDAADLGPVPPRCRDRDHAPEGSAGGDLARHPHLFTNPPR